MSSDVVFAVFANGHIVKADTSTNPCTVMAEWRQWTGPGTDVSSVSPTPIQKLYPHFNNKFIFLFLHIQFVMLRDGLLQIDGGQLFFIQKWLQHC